MQIKGVITRAVGTHETVEIDYGVGPALAGDTWLLCSDGLTDEVPDESIREILTSSRNVEEGADRLIEGALSAGGHDNVTVVIGHVIESPADPADGEQIPLPTTFEPMEGPPDEGAFPGE
jgi:protein phosphatase